MSINKCILNKKLIITEYSKNNISGINTLLSKYDTYIVLDEFSNTVLKEFKASNEKELLKIITTNECL